MTQPFTFGKPKSPSLILQASPNEDPLGQYDVGDVIGSFLGFLRRAKATKHGLTAQIFGENGNDADFITALHLTRYLDAPVKVSVWMVKDKNGKLSDDKGQKHPLITQFIGRIRRPVASDMGQTAQFFGENGPNSDAVNKLNESRYLDALVLVELQKAMPGLAAADIQTNEPSDELERGKERLTSEEESRLKKHQKRADQALTALRQHGFFANETVLRKLGTQEDYKEWLTSQTCCHPQPGAGVCGQGPVLPMDVVNPRMRAYNQVPLCTEHREQWLSEAPPEIGVQGGQAFLASQTRIHVQRWAQEALRKKLNVPAGFLPSPSLIFGWAAENEVRGMLPSGFSHFMEQA